MKLSSAQRHFFDNALLIAAMRLIFMKLKINEIPLCDLKDIVDTTSGGTPQRNINEYFGGQIPWIKSGELNDGIIKTESLKGVRNTLPKKV